MNLDQFNERSIIGPYYSMGQRREREATVATYIMHRVNMKGELEARDGEDLACNLADRIREKTKGEITADEIYMTVFTSLVGRLTPVTAESLEGPHARHRIIALRQLPASIIS